MSLEELRGSNTIPPPLTEGFHIGRQTFTTQTAPSLNLSVETVTFGGELTAPGGIRVGEQLGTVPWVRLGELQRTPAPITEGEELFSSKGHMPRLGISSSDTRPETSGAPCAPVLLEGNQVGHEEDRSFFQGME